MGDEHGSMEGADVRGYPPYATPELPPKASKACPDDLGRFSLSEFTPTKRGSPKVNTPTRPLRPHKCNMQVFIEEHAH